MVKIASIFRRAAKWQIVSTVVIGLVALWLADMPGLISAILGGGSVLIGSFVASRIAIRSENSNQAGAILVNMLIAEAVKLLLIVLLLWVSFKIYADHIVVMALFSALAAAAILSGTAVYALNSESEKQG
jgi:ATP synthase protein I